MSDHSRFKCPACGFPIYNRRVVKCESCNAPLPQDLLLNANQIADLDAEFEKSRKLREERIKRGRRRETTWGGEGSLDGDGDGGGGDGGGGD